MTLGILVHGAAGRMGRAVIAVAHASGDITIRAAIDGAAGPAHGRDAGELAGVGAIGALLTDAFDGAKHADVAIDFSTPAALPALARYALAHGVALVVGTTGLERDPSAIAALDEAARHVPVVVASNFSVGVAVLAHLVGIATKLLGEGYEAELVEMHHRHKRDAPSGTALTLAREIARTRGKELEAVLVTGRAGTSLERRPGEIGVHSMRGGDVIGEHTVVFAGAGERVELSHRAGSRELFAIGALRAARWVMGRAPGRYGMKDVLGL